MYLMVDFIVFFAYRIMHVVTREYIYSDILLRMGILTDGSTAGL